MKKNLIWILSLACFTSSADEHPEISPEVFILPPMQVEATQDTRRTVFETLGTIQVIEGTACGTSNRTGTEIPITVDGILTLPSYATDATVFVNGWDVEYLSSDHHIGRVATRLDEVKTEGGQLKWKATGVLRDKNFDDGFRWCYFYTTLAWNRTQIDARVLGVKDTATYSFFNKSQEVALVSAPAFFQSEGLSAGRNAAVLPRGFVFGWEEGFNQADHHLFHMALNIDHAETYLQANRNWSGPGPGVSRSQASGFVSWEAHGVYKDNRSKRDFGFGTWNTVIGGRGVHFKQPPFTIIPNEEASSGCIYTPGGVRTIEEVVEGVPYQFAIPVLTGWELYYQCDDEHVKQTGVWIHDIRYEKSPLSPVGTLRYKVSHVLRDRNSSPGHVFRHKVGILGMSLTPAIP